MPVAELARRREIPGQFLEQLFATLRRAGLLRSQRGVHGGYVLTRDPREITLSANFATVVAATDAEVADRLDAIEARLAPYLGDAIGGYMAEYRSGAALVGTPAMIVERLRALQAEGLAYAIHYFPEHAYDRTGVDLFEREVVPALR